MRLCAVFPRCGSLKRIFIRPTCDDQHVGRIPRFASVCHVMSQLPLLRFRPLLKQYLWGGRRLAELGKPLGDGDDYAESWEVVDHGPDQSVVTHGPLAGTTLHELVTSRGAELLGQHAPQTRFPLLFKFLDAQRKLSVQVHPNDAQAAQLQPPDLGKTEAWVVVDAEPGATLYAGLKRGFDRAALEGEIDRGTCDSCLHQLDVSPGDCVFLPAGTVHAIGAGLLIAEIQQSSDTTYRVFDWNRVGTDGKPRQLHVEQALAVIDFDRGPVDAQQPQPTDRTAWERLVECDKFIMDRATFSEGSQEAGQDEGQAATATTGGDNRFHLLAVLCGDIRVTATNISDPEVRPEDLTRGDTLLVPSSTGEVQLEPDGDAVVLDIYLP